MKVPSYIFLAQFSDDTLDVICHFHHNPTESELQEQKEMYDNNEVVKYLVATAICEL
jgi:hypothetical protein